ncbi:SMP-30/gluconolactonase/LRE family protein [Rufibacter psychrotolerans]|uniref:SMP-30/gluconolactonase/LRE family protein n=1 Tax=Rufibacter psychrotolerans TaxID=2812556 RepID=UPI0019683781|nr:SMP-30/gluconolactonase/LRE family protein [Rufibacter sp. SYSU D00308]
MQKPYSVAIDGAGNTFVTDRYQHQVIKFNPAGQALARFGSFGSGNGQFKHPVGVAVDAAGNVYVGDQVNNRVQKFSPNPDGTYAYDLQFGSSGRNDGQFDGEIRDIAVDAAGNVFVVDNGMKRVQKFSPTGVLLNKFGKYGNGEGEFWSPYGITVDQEGIVYVLDQDRQKINKFKLGADGAYAFLGAFGNPIPRFSGTEDGVLVEPASLAVDEAGNVYVTERGNHRVHKFNSAGAYLGKFGVYGSTEGTFDRPTDIAIDPTGNVVILSETRIQKFTAAGGYLANLGENGASAGDFNGPSYMATDKDGNLYVSDRENHRVQKFSPAGAFLAQFGSLGSADGQFKGPAGIVVDGSGDVYVADEGNDRIQRFSLHPDGTYSFALKFGTRGSGNGQLNQPAGLALDHVGNVVVADATNNRLQKFSPTGIFMHVIGGWGSTNGLFNSPRSIAIDATGHLFVADWRNSRVQKFSPSVDGTYTYVTQFGGFGFYAGSMLEPSAIALGVTGNVYVVDDGNNTMQRFQLQDDGSYLFQTALNLAGNGLKDAFGVALDKNGSLYVSDIGTHQITRFSEGVAGGDMQVKWGGTVIPHNGTFDFGGYSGSPISFTFRIGNLSASSLLEFTGSPKVEVTGPQASAFSPQTMFLPASIDPNDNTSLTVNFQPTAVGPQQAQLVIKTNDPAKNPYIIHVTGTNTVLSTREELAPETIALHPNPTTGQVTLDLGKLEAQTCQVQVLGAQGQPVLEKEAKPSAQKLSLNLQHLPAGMYLVRVQTDRQFVVKRMVKR